MKQETHGALFFLEQTKKYLRTGDRSEEENVDQKSDRIASQFHCFSNALLDIYIFLATVV